MTKPDLTHLGVTDPTTGKPVYLSAGEISSVLGATGGVAPTGLQAGVAGFVQGAQVGQNFITGISNIQAQQGNIASVAAQTEAQNIQNEISKQTENATILAKNNQVQQAGITAQIQTQKLTDTNTVLQAVRSGDPQKLTDTISDPKLLSAALEQDTFIQSAFGQMKGSMTPVQLAAFDKYNTTRDIFKAGPLQDNYQKAADGIASTLPFQQLKAASGLGTNDLLNQMSVQQIQTPSGLPATAIVAPNGKSVLIDPTAKDHNEAVAGFFGARDKFQTAGRYDLPTPGGTTPPSPQIDQTGASTPSTVGITANSSAIPGVGAAANLPPQAKLPDAAQTPVAQDQSTAAASASTPTPNPNAVSPYGNSLLTTEPKLQAYNTKTNTDGVPIAADLQTKAVAIFQRYPPGTVTLPQAYAMAEKEALMKAKLTPKANDVAIQNTIKANHLLDMAARVDQVKKQAEDVGLQLGPTYLDEAYRGMTGANAMLDSGLNSSIGDIKSKFDVLKNEHVLAIAQSSGLGVTFFRSVAEQNRIAASAPSLSMSPQVLDNISAMYRSRAAELTDENTLTQKFDTLGIPAAQAKQYVADYFANNRSFTFDENGNYIANPSKVNPTEFSNEKLGINTNDVANKVFETPTAAPASSTSAQPPAMGSETATPFAPAQKQPTSAFPQAEPKAEARGAGYNESPATMKDLKAIADTAASGGNVRQFQSAGSLPIKMDKATPDMVARVIGGESSGNKNAVSPTGVKGLMMVTQKTFAGEAKDVTDISLTDRRDPVQSVVAGTSYLNKMLKRFDGNVDLALASYNAGPETVQKILDDHNLSTDNATIGMIAPFLPTTQPTEKYVNLITSRGRVGDAPQAEKTGGFFDAVSKSDLNPFKVGEAQAEDNVKPPAGNTPTSENPTGAPTDLGTIGLTDKPKPPPDGGSFNPFSIATAQADTGTTDAVVKPKPLDNSPRNDVPPVSEIQQALKPTEGGMGVPGELASVGKAVQFIRTSPIGKFLGEVQKTQGFAAAENFANAATFGMYDEGMNIFQTEMGFDGALVQNQIRDELKTFRKANPRLATSTDILGSVAGGVGAGYVLRALKGAQIAGDAIKTMTAAEGAKIGAAQGAARGFGEGESTGQRIVNAAAGGTVGAALGTAGALIPSIPGAAPVMAGAAVGGVAGGLKTGTASGVVEGAAIGGAAGLGISQGMKFAPSVQKAIASAVVKLNNKFGLQTFGTLAQKMATGKSPAEVAADLSPVEAYLAKLLSYKKSPELESIIESLKTVQKDNPDVPSALIDYLKNAEPKTLVKLLGQMSNSPELSDKINTFLSSRITGQAGRIEDQLGTPDLVQQAANKLLQTIEGKVSGARSSAIANAGPIYSSAESLTPEFNSTTMDDLLSTPAMKTAVSEAKSELSATIPKNTASEADRIVQRVQAGETLNDIVANPEKDPSTLSSKAFNVVRLARQKLMDRINSSDTSPELKKTLGDLHRSLTEEMKTLNPKFEQANATYAAEMAKADFITKSHQLDVVRNLADGNVEDAIPKLLKMNVKDLQDFADGLNSPAELKDVAKGFLLKKLQTGIAGKEVATKLIKKGDWPKIEILLGKDETAQLKSMMEAESNISISGRSLTGGSDTVPKAQGMGAMQDIAGGDPGVFKAGASIAAGSWKGAVANSVKVLFRALKPSMNPDTLNELSDTLLLNLPKGISAMEKVLKAQGLKDAEMKAIQPYLNEWQDAFRQGGMGLPTSIEGQVLENAPKPKKKK